jgi:hypothetical protein
MMHAMGTYANVAGRCETYSSARAAASFIVATCIGGRLASMLTRLLLVAFVGMIASCAASMLPRRHTSVRRTFRLLIRHASRLVVDRIQPVGAYVSGPWWGRSVDVVTGRKLVGVAIKYQR